MDDGNAKITGHHPPLSIRDLQFSWDLCPSILVEDQASREQALLAAIIGKDYSNEKKEEEEEEVEEDQEVELKRKNVCMEI